MTKILVILIAGLVCEAIGVVFLSKGLKQIGEVKQVNAAEIWRAVKAGRFAGFKFRRQHPVGIYFLDCYCPMARLAVADGITAACTTPHIHVGRYGNDAASLEAAAAPLRGHRNRERPSRGRARAGHLAQASTHAGVPRLAPLPRRERVPRSGARRREGREGREGRLSACARRAGTARIEGIP